MNHWQGNVATKFSFEEEKEPLGRSCLTLTHSHVALHFYF